MPLLTKKDLSNGVPGPIRRWVTDQLKIVEKRLKAYIDEKLKEVS